MTHIKFKCNCGHVSYWPITSGRINEFSCEKCKKRIGYTDGRFMKWYIPTPNADNWDTLSDREMERRRERERERIRSFQSYIYGTGTVTGFTTTAGSWDGTGNTVYY